MNERENMPVSETTKLLLDHIVTIITRLDELDARLTDLEDSDGEREIEE